MKRIRPFPFDRLPQLARSQVAAGGTLLAHLPLEPGAGWRPAQAPLGEPLTFSIGEAYAFPVEELPLRTQGTLVQMAAPPDRQVLLVLDATLALRLGRRALGFDRVELAPAPLTTAEQAALAGLLSGLLEGQPFQPAGFFDPTAPPTDGYSRFFPDPWVLALEVRLCWGGRESWARLLAPERLRMQPAAPHSEAEVKARLVRLGTAAVALRMEVGRARFGRQELCELGRRDVVLFEDFGPRPPFGGPVMLRLGQGGFAAQLSGDGLTILEPFRLGSATMEKPNDDPQSAPLSDASTDGLLRQLPVELVCELGRVTMSGRELLELRPGAVLPVGRPLAGPVDLTVGGRLVARGELVEIEGEIGVRVNQMSD